MMEPMDFTETTLEREERFQGKIFSVHVDKVRLPDGKTSVREVIEHGPGVAVLPIDDEGNVLTVTQYRYVIGKPHAMNISPYWSGHISHVRAVRVYISSHLPLSSHQAAEYISISLVDSSCCRAISCRPVNAAYIRELVNA